jgi:pimeloyl-ACP methyl ester carboxylesterase
MLQSARSHARRLITPRTRLHLAGLVASGALVGTGGLCLGVGYYGASSINARRQRWFSDTFVLTPETLRLPYRKVGFTTEDGVELQGWYIESCPNGKRSERQILCCCPYNQDKSSLLGVARGLWDAGYSVLLFDFRSHAPRPTAQTVGFLECRDGRAALDWLIDNAPSAESRVGLMGASMGGAVALTLASEGRPQIVGCATDCAFYSLRDVVAVRLDKLFAAAAGVFGSEGRLPLNALFVECVCLLNKLVYGYDPTHVGPKGKLGDVTIPLLIVHSEFDSVVPCSHGFKIYEEAATAPSLKEFCIVAATEHIGAYFKDERQYVRRIVHFMDKVFDRSAPGGPVGGSDSIFLPGHEVVLHSAHDSLEGDLVRRTPPSKAAVATT